MERDILVEVNHPFIVKLHYGKRTLEFCSVDRHLQYIMHHILAEVELDISCR